MVMTLRYFAFRAPLITQARIEEKFLSRKLDKFTFSLPIPSSA